MADLRDYENHIVVERKSDKSLDEEFRIQKSKKSMFDVDQEHTEEHMGGNHMKKRDADHQSQSYTTSHNRESSYQDVKNMFPNAKRQQASPALNTLEYSSQLQHKLP